MSRLVLRGLRSTLAGPFDMEVDTGECVAVTGASGAGKSLFLRMIADLDPHEGEAWLDGRPRADFAPPAWRRQVVYNPAEPGWWAERPIDHFPPEAIAAVRALAARLDLAPDRLDDAVERLSTGERQRAALIRALLLDPPVLLLDEPTGALDRETTARVEAVLLERLAAGVAAVVVTHSPEQAMRLGTRQLRMCQRTLVGA